MRKSSTFEQKLVKNKEKEINPNKTLWFEKPAKEWIDALPVGNGRLGAMVFGKTEEEKIQFNEETHWSGGPYNSILKGSHKHLSKIQKLIFEGEYKKAHKLFGRHLMGYPIEQQKYQSTGDLVLKFNSKGDVTNYVNKLELDKAIVTTSFTQDKIQYKREVFSTPIDQVIVVRLTASKPESISFIANLNGYRNNTHSNYGTDYYKKDGFGNDGLILDGKSDDYLGIKGKLRYQARAKVIPENGTMIVEDENLKVDNADAVTIYIAANTNFVNYKDVSGNPQKKIDSVLEKIVNKSYNQIKEDHIKEHQKYFKRLSIELESTENSFLPTDKRIKKFNGKNDPSLASLCLQYGRYMLISSSRPNTQPANLQGIWNDKLNPNWDSKYTTNINLQMNYWPSEVCNLTEFSQPLFKLIEEITDQGTDVAKEHYGKKGWVLHQNTDIWRVAAPMDGTQWGTFTTGGAWLCTHLWEHYLFTEDKKFLEKAYPIMKGCVDFFLDFLIKHPKKGWLVTNPSTSPENFPGREGNYEPFFDEIPHYNSPGTTICSGSTIDMQILNDLFNYTIEASKVLDIDSDFRKSVLNTKNKLAPMQIGKNGELQEWLYDWEQKEKSHRHISHLYGLFPGNQISVKNTPNLAEAAEAVLNQRGLVGNGWASAWKMGCWARLYNSDKAIENFTYSMNNYTTKSLFSTCANYPQVDGVFGTSASLAEMLIQSHENEINLLPSLPSSWKEGSVEGLCARKGFQIGLKWSENKLDYVSIFSRLGNSVPIRYKNKIIKLKTEKNKNYRLDGNLNEI